MKINHGGRRSNSGRKPDTEIKQLREIMGAVWNEAARKKALKSMSDLAATGDINAVRLLMSYAYGTPPSGDEMKVREAVKKELDGFIELVNKRLTKEDAERILSLLFAPVSDADIGQQD